MSEPFLSASTAYRDFGAALSEPIYDEVQAAAFPQHILRHRNDRAAAQVGLAGLPDADWIDYFGRFRPLPGAQAVPLALRYHGHQFRSYNPEIGDGRGFLFGQAVAGDGRLLDFGTKGSGQTPYSRFGDGRLTLKGAVRELLATEMLEALGVYTSKTLSVIETGEALERNDEPSPTRSAVMVRLSHSHIRFGTFQYLAYHNRHGDIRQLIDFAIAHYFPHLASLDGDMRVVAFYGEVIARSASLVASWNAAGFVHGVLNTDNMVITGESFDYGPWRFLPVLDPAFTAAYFDQTGLYAYGRQAEAVAWNLAQLGGTLLPLSDEETLNAALQTYGAAYEGAMEARFARRFGVEHMPVSFIGQWMAWMQETGAPFEQVIFDWMGGAASADRAAASPVKELYAKNSWKPLGDALAAAPPRGDIEQVLAHPYFQGEKPCTMLIDEMEALWAPIDEADDWQPLAEKLVQIGEMREAYGLDQTAILAPSPLKDSAEPA